MDERNTLGEEIKATGERVKGATKDPSARHWQ